MRLDRAALGVLHESGIGVTSTELRMVLAFSLGKTVLSPLTPVGDGVLPQASLIAEIGGMRPLFEPEELELSIRRRVI